MRVAAESDTPAVAAMISARCDWLEKRGLASLRQSVNALADQCGDDTVWVLTTMGGDVVGCTTVLDHGPARDWTAEERKVPALYLFSTVTHPDYRGLKPGTVIAHWSVDLAARQGKYWVRRGCLDVELLRYYRMQGFSLVREIEVRTGTLYVMARRAERVHPPMVVTSEA